MNYAQIKTFLGHLGQKHVQHGGKYARCTCPLAPWKHQGGHDSHPSFGISIEESGRSHYNCFSCGSGGPLDDLLMELLHLNKDNSVPMNLVLAYRMLEKETEEGYSTVADWSEFGKLDNRPVEPWPESWLASFKSALVVNRAREYMTQVRHIPEKVMAYCDMRYDSMRDAVCFPIRDKKGRLVGMRGRYIAPKGDTRYHDYVYNDINNTSLVWLGEDRVDWSLPVVVAEGGIDYATILRWYKNTITPLSISASKSKLKALFNAPTVVCFFDNDTGGEQGYAKMADLLKKETVVQRVTYPPYLTAKEKDANSIPEQLVPAMLSPFVPVSDMLVDD